jgi:hypothetical protein
MLLHASRVFVDNASFPEGIRKIPTPALFRHVPQPMWSYSYHVETRNWLWLLRTALDNQSLLYNILLKSINPYSIYYVMTAIYCAVKKFLPEMFVCQSRSVCGKGGWRSYAQALVRARCRIQDMNLNICLNDHGALPAQGFVRMLISKRSFLNLTRSKIGIIRIWEKRRTEGVEKSASRIIRAARFCSRRMWSKSVFEQFPHWSYRACQNIAF